MASELVVELTEDSFQSEVLASTQPVLVDFWADWCGPCKMIAPSVTQLATDYQGRVKVAKVDVDQAPGLAGQFNISSIPTLLIFKGGEVVEQIVGVKPLSQLKASLDRALA
jgi:thioredoxin 1